MTGINKRSNQPTADQKKMVTNLSYGPFAIIKSVSDAYAKATGQTDKKKGK